MPNYCTKCGESLSSTDNYCGECGHELGGLSYLTRKCDLTPRKHDFSKFDLSKFRSLSSKCPRCNGKGEHDPDNMPARLAASIFTLGLAIPACEPVKCERCGGSGRI